MNLREIQNELRTKYEAYNIDDSIYEDALKKVSEEFTDFADIKFEAEKIISKYIIDEIKKENIDYQIILIDKYQFLKKQLSVKPKYKTVVANINSAYEQAIENLTKNYDSDKLISVNILDNMKSILDKKINGLDNSIEDETTQINSDEIYDLSFIKPYIGKNGYVLADFANDIKTSYLKVNDYLYGKKKATEEQLEKLYRRFNVTEYDSLKEKIEMLLNAKTVTTEIIGVKKNISYLKEYVKYYPEEKEKLKKKLKCGDEYLDNLLKGTSFVDKNQFNVLLKNFNAKNEKHLIRIINKLVNNKKKNQKSENIKTIYEYVGAYNHDVEKVDVIISFILTDYEKSFLRRIYGENLHKIKNDSKITTKEENILKNIVEKIKTDFIAFDKVYAYDSYEEKYILRKYFSQKIKNIYERVEAKNKVEIEKVDIIIELALSDEEKTFLKRIYGEDLKNPKRTRPLTKIENKDLNILIIKIKNRLNKFDKYFEFDGKNYTLIKKEEKTKSNEVDSSSNSTAKKVHKVKSIYERAGSSSDEEKRKKVDAIIEFILTNEEKEFLKIAYGEDLKNPNREKVLTISEQHILDKLIQKIKNRLNKFDTYFKLEDENYILITKEEKNKSDVIVNNSNSTINKIKSIYERIGSKTEEEIEKVDIIIKLAFSKEDKELLKIAYGEDLKNPNRERSLSQAEDKKLFVLIQKIKNRLNKFDKYFEFDGENYNLIKKGGTSKKKVVCNLEKKENINTEGNDIETIDKETTEEPIIINKVHVSNDIKASSDIKQSYKTILDSLKSPEYKDIFRYLNYEQITAASLLLVYNHSVSKVAEILNIDEKTVVKDCELVLEFYRKYINTTIDDAIEQLKNEMVLYTLEFDKKESK